MMQHSSKLSTSYGSSSHSISGGSRSGGNGGRPISGRGGATSTEDINIRFAPNIFTTTKSNTSAKGIFVRC